MKFKREIFLISLFVVTILTFSSCHHFKAPKTIQKELKYCYDGKNTGLDTLINIHGYFSMGQPRDRYGMYAVFKHIIDTFYINFMFFPDGIFLYNFGTCDHNIPEYFKQIVERTKVGKPDPFFKYFCWGTYHLHKDTINAQCFHIPGSLNDGWYIWETSFKIISKNVLKEITLKSSKFKADSFESLPAKFQYVNILPPSDAKLKQFDWFWCKNRK